jgi:hypothetical protein
MLRLVARSGGVGGSELDSAPAKVDLAPAQVYSAEEDLEPVAAELLLVS